VPRVVITGIGVISAIGLTRDAFWRSLVDGKCGIHAVNSPDFEQLRFKHAADVEGFVPEDHLSAKELTLMDRFAQFAVVTAREAMAQSGLELTPAMREDGAIITGSCIGGRSAEEVGYRELYIHGRNRVHPLTIPLGMSNAATSHISMQFGIQGPSYTISTACASSGHAIGQAFHMVRSGIAPVAIAGGSEAPLYFGNLKAWEAMRVISKDTCRPFSADRSGLVLGEGAAMLVLEPLEAALVRGAKPIAEIVGFGMSADACHITQPSAEGPARAMRMALRDAGLAPEQIGYINAHGTATEVNDRTETAAIRLVFGAHADKLAVSSTKSMHAHTLGAAGAIEAAASALTLAKSIIPPTVNYSRPDPVCDLDFVPNTAREQQVEACLSNSFAFGGLNAVLALRRFA
jgi:nodulation protein E